MSKPRPSDTFTRFTSNTPTNFRPSSLTSSAASPSLTASGPQPITQPSSFPAGPPGETPAQRVARLRALNQQRRLAELTTSDKIIASGRKIADYAHRYTAYSLLLFSGVATIFAAYGLVSLVSHNRTQKRAWIEREMDRLDDARRAFLAGTANAEQLHLLEQERAGEILRAKYEDEKKKNKEAGYFGKLKSYFTSTTGKGDLGVEEPKRERLERLPEELGQTPVQNTASPASSESRGTKMVRMGDTEVAFRPVAVQDSAIKGVGLDEKGRPVPANKMERVPITADREVVKEIRQLKGGPLDVLAGNAVVETKQAGSSWWGWINGEKP